MRKHESIERAIIGIGVATVILIFLAIFVTLLREQEEDIDFLKANSEIESSELTELSDTFRDYVKEQKAQDLKEKQDSKSIRNTQRVNILYGMVNQDSSDISTLKSEVETLKTEVKELRKLVSQLKK